MGNKGETLPERISIILRAESPNYGDYIGPDEKKNEILAFLGTESDLEELRNAAIVYFNKVLKRLQPTQTRDFRLMIQNTFWKSEEVLGDFTIQGYIPTDSELEQMVERFINHFRSALDRRSDFFKQDFHEYLKLRVRDLAISIIKDQYFQKPEPVADDPKVEDA